jgi:hypothetical protein
MVEKYLSSIIKSIIIISLKYVNSLTAWKKLHIVSAEMFLFLEILMISIILNLERFYSLNYKNTLSSI